ncbi:hypothetical protein [Butyrivibrio sp. AE3004]|uniref:hypothetical protein n=1 Tax=Butyrivibrio sp. AE3004 TaxID=1506994 RepID=UPI000493E977|nr:hypothetical protein [Butyrivibrio sp. AE3004]
MTLIKLHERKKQNKELYFNIDDISVVSGVRHTDENSVKEIKDVATIYLNSGVFFDVDETIDEVLDLMGQQR